MGARLQSAVADLHLKVDRFAEEHLLADATLPDVLAFGPRFGKPDIFWPHREDHFFPWLQRFHRPDLHFAERRAHAVVTRRRRRANNGIAQIRGADEVGHELVARPLIDLARRADLLDA